MYLTTIPISSQCHVFLYPVKGYFTSNHEHRENVRTLHVNGKLVTSMAVSERYYIFAFNGCKMGMNLQVAKQPRHGIKAPR